MDEVREQLEETKDGIVRSVRSARNWLLYNQACLAFYQEWLRHPDLQPPEREFPDWSDYDR